jgi:hypothetical protein
LGELIDLIGTGRGDRENRSKDILGRVYGYFLVQKVRKRDSSILPEALSGS